MHFGLFVPFELVHKDDKAGYSFCSSAYRKVRYLDQNNVQGTLRQLLFAILPLSVVAEPHGKILACPKGQGDPIQQVNKDIILSDNRGINELPLVSDQQLTTVGESMRVTMGLSPHLCRLGTRRTGCEGGWERTELQIT